MAFRVAEIIGKTECCKHPKNYYLEVHHLINLDYYYLLVTGLHSLPQCSTDGHRSMFPVSCALSLGFAFPVWKWSAKVTKKDAANLFANNNLRQFRKFNVPRFLVLAISRKCDIMAEKWAYINLDKSVYAFVE